MTGRCLRGERDRFPVAIQRCVPVVFRATRLVPRAKGDRVLLRNHVPGQVLAEQGEDIDDPDAYHQLTHYMASFWPYDADCRLIGEHIYEDRGSRTIEKMDPADVITPQQAREMLAPLLAEH